MKIIDGKNIVMGRLASYAAKELLKGEEVVVVNCNEVIISGSGQNLEREFQEKRERYGSSQKGPKISKSSEKIVKRAIRGMLPSHRVGRGSSAWKRLKCYNKIPKEYDGKEFIEIAKEKKVKSIKVCSLVSKNE